MQRFLILLGVFAATCLVEAAASSKPWVSNGIVASKNPAADLRKGKGLIEEDSVLASKLLESVCKAEPLNQNAFVAAADSLMRSGFPGTALLYLQQAVTIQDDDEASWLKIAMTSDVLGGSHVDLGTGAYERVVNITTLKIAARLKRLGSQDEKILKRLGSQDEKFLKRLRYIQSMALDKLPALVYQRAAGPKTMLATYEAELAFHEGGLFGERDVKLICRTQMKLALLHYHWRPNGEESLAKSQMALKSLQALANTTQGQICQSFFDPLIFHQIAGGPRAILKEQIASGTEDNMLNKSRIMSFLAWSGKGGGRIGVQAPSSQHELVSEETRAELKSIESKLASVKEKIRTIQKEITAGIFSNAKSLVDLDMAQKQLKVKQLQTEKELGKTATEPSPTCTNVPSDAKDGGWPLTMLNGSISAALKEVMASACEIDRRTLTPDQFWEDYASKSRPVILQGMMTNWQAWFKWTKANLQNEYGDLKVKLMRSARVALQYENAPADGAHDLKSKEYHLLPIAKFIKEHVVQEETNGRNERNPHYMFGSFGDYLVENNTTKEAARYRNLVNQYESMPHFKPEKFDREIDDRARRHLFYIGRPGSGTFFHKHQSAWNALAFGRKLWFLLPPGGNHYGGDSAVVNDNGLSMVEWVNRVWPLISKLRSSNQTKHNPIFTCTQQSGEVLYVPQQWEHATINTQTAVGLSVDVGSFKDLKV